MIARLEDPGHRELLRENLEEESGIYEQAELEALEAQGLKREWFDRVPHPQLFDRFARSLGVEPREREPVEEVRRWSERFLEVLSGGSPAQAVGALGLGTELIVQAMEVALPTRSWPR